MSDQSNSFSGSSSSFDVNNPESIPYFLPRGATIPNPIINMNNCMTKLVASVIGGGLMGMVFGPIFSSSVLTNPIDQDPNATFRQKVFSVCITHKSRNIYLLFIDLIKKRVGKI